MKENIKTRLKSRVLWMSFIGLVGLVLQSTGVFDRIGLASSEWDAIITSLGSFLAALGIFNNPADSEHI